MRDLRWRRRSHAVLRRGFIGLALTAASASCGALLDLEALDFDEPVGPADVATLPEASSGEGGVDAPVDAPVDAVKVGCARFPSKQFCRDFDTVSRADESWPQLEVTGGSRIALLPLPSAPSRPNVFESALTPTDAAGSYIARLSFQKPNAYDGTKTPKITIDLEVFVAEAPEGFVNLFNLEVGSNATGPDGEAATYDTLLFRARTVGTSWSPELHYISPGMGFIDLEPVKTFDTILTPSKQWSHVRFDVNPRQADTNGAAGVVLTFVTAGGASSHAFNTKVRLPRNVRIDIGASSPVGGFRILYDDVAIDYE